MHRSCVCNFPWSKALKKLVDRLKIEARAIYTGKSYEPTSATIMVMNHAEKKMLSRMGYFFDSKDLETWEVEAYSIIESIISDVKNEGIKKSGKRS